MNGLIRMDIDNAAGKTPKLVGLAIHGFGWIIGGAAEGGLSISINMDGSWTPFETSGSSQSQVDRFRRRVENRKWGDKIWEVK